MVDVLDCTLRDGGYYTDWDFSPEDVATYIDSIARLPITYVEIGYINDAMEGYFGEYFYLTRPKIQAIRDKLRPDQKLVVMVDGKAVVPERIEALFGGVSDLVDLVRITAAPNALAHALSIARELKKLGIAVGFNVMYLSTFQNDIGKIRAAIDSADEYDSLALVDSYGGCTPASVGALFRELRRLLPKMTIGFHGHDNMCLAFANTLAAIENGADVVDGTFTGMGRGAGNLRTETVLIHLAREGANQDLDYQALSNAVAPFERMRKIHEWGTNLPYMLSGANNLPQKDVMDWLSKNRFSVLSIIRALQRQSGQEVDRNEYPDVADLKLDAGSVLLVGGGPSVQHHAEAIRALVERYDPVVIFSSTRHLPLAGRIGGRQLLCLPGHDAFRVPVEQLQGVTAAVVSAPPRVPDCIPAGMSVPVYQAAPLPVPGAHGPESGPVSDSGPLALGLGVAEALGADQCWLVGFDGYDTASLAEQDLSREVQQTLDAYLGRRGAKSLVSLTPTHYGLPKKTLHGLVAAV